MRTEASKSITISARCDEYESFSGQPAELKTETACKGSGSTATTTDSRIAVAGICSCAAAAEGFGIAVIDARPLIRECLTRALRSVIDGTIMSYSNIESWYEVAKTFTPSIFLLCVDRAGELEAQRQLSFAMQVPCCSPIMLIGEVEDPERVFEAIDKGARGYIPTSLSLAVAVQALRLVAEGGVFVPASSMIAARKQIARPAQAAPCEPELFTSRQAAVVRALCRGKANKAIAYELNMCESTVKVHVRTIMKKLKAKNRTEVAIMVKSLEHDVSTHATAGIGTACAKA